MDNKSYNEVMDLIHYEQDIYRDKLTEAQNILNKSDKSNAHHYQYILFQQMLMTQSLTTLDRFERIFMDKYKGELI